MVLGLDDSENVISILDGENTLLTDSLRQNGLFEDGFIYEACSSQALMIETLCSMYMGLQHQAYKIPMLDVKGKDVGIEPKATFGRVVNLLVLNNAFHAESISEKLRLYVDLRNQLVHTVSGTSSSFNFIEFFELGKEITIVLKNQLYWPGMVSLVEWPFQCFYCL